MTLRNLLLAMILNATLALLITAQPHTSGGSKGVASTPSSASTGKNPAVADAQRTSRQAETRKATEATTKHVEKTAPKPSVKVETKELSRRWSADAVARRNEKKKGLTTIYERNTSVDPAGKSYVGKVQRNAEGKPLNTVEAMKARGREHAQKLSREHGQPVQVTMKEKAHVPKPMALTVEQLYTEKQGRHNLTNKANRSDKKMIEDISRQTGRSPAQVRVQLEKTRNRWAREHTRGK